MKRATEGGFVSILSLTVLMAVIAILISSLVARTGQIALISSRSLAQTQLKWLAHGAAEEALALLKEGPVPLPLHHHDSLWVSPAFGDVDPLAQWDIHPIDFQPQAIEARYSYRLEPGEAADRYRVHTRASMTFHGKPLISHQSFVIVLEEGRWLLQPISPSP